MGMTRAQLLASLGARRVSGEVCSNRDGTYLEAVICYGDAARACLPVCIFQALATAELFAPVAFVVGDRPYLQDGAWHVFTPADACAFVRAVMRELEAKRLPDLDALLTVAEGSNPPRVIDWRGR